MNIKLLASVGTIATLLLTGCGDDSGITLAPTTNTSNSNNTTGTGTPAVNPCASYQVSGQTKQGTFDGTNCTYDVTFVSDTNPLTADLTIPALASNGVHIFEDSLFVGEDVTSNAASAGVHIPQDGEGPRLTVAPGSLIAFSSSQDYVRIARGSRIIAEGTESNPIIFSAVDDLINNVATESDRGLWGGVQLNGNGITNKCDDASRMATASNPHNCHVTAEGRPSTYGGNNNAENSGSLRYVQIRYAGFEVVDGDELNGLTLNAIGSGTNIEYVQTYTTQDDGFELFGGAVNLKHIVAINAGDDSIDFSEGYVGNIQFALVIHTSGANQCIEGDNNGSNNSQAPFTKLRISNMTCLTSNVAQNMGTEPSSKGSSEGPRYREGAYFEQYNSIITSSDAAMASQNYCLEIKDTVTTDGANSGISAAAGNLIACSAPTSDNNSATFDIDAFLAATPGDNVVIDTNLPATVLEGLDTNPRAYITAAAFADSTTAAVNVNVFDVTTLNDTFAADAAPAVGSSGDSSFFEAVNYIGAVDASDDWVSAWVIGL